MRLVETARVGSTVKQSTLLYLGSHFDLPQDQWPALARRIDELLRGQPSLLNATLSVGEPDRYGVPSFSVQ